VLNTSVLEFPAGNIILDEYRCFPPEITDSLPDVPALPETLLTMEFQLQENSVDLRGFTEVVLGDLGATLQIFRLAGQEYGSAEDCPMRIEDCISDLGLTACLNAAASGTLVRGAQQRANFEIWTHSREIAKHCKFLAEEMPGSINPDQAYIVGLLHAIGTLPDVLGWHWDDAPENQALSALKLAELWHLPRYVKDFFKENLMHGRNPRWSEFLAAAHQLAKVSWARCPVAPVTARSVV
jgi:hypothetical protein